MSVYKGRVALVTGAGAGIGAAITKALLREGVHVVGVARRPLRVQALAVKDAPGKLYALEGDISKEESILGVFKWIRENLSGVDILINNAAEVVDEDLTTAPTESWRRMLDVNVLGLSICTREAIQDMVRRGVDDGFVIHINGLWGHSPPPSSKVAMAAATKQAVKALLEGLRKDLVARKSHIRVGQISPGLVKTELLTKLKSLTPDILNEVPYLEPEDIANAVIYMLSQHPRVQALALKDAPGKLYALEGDASKEESILGVFKWIRENLSGVDILINNVAVLVDEDLTSAPTESWRRMLDVNVLGLSICTREAIQDMARRGVDDGFVIHINGLWGHNPPPNSKVAMAAATKQAVTALLEGLRKDLVARKSNIRVGQISPGLVKTEFYNKTKYLTPDMFKSAPYLEPEDIANAVIYMLSQHPRVQVHDILIHPTCDPF